MSRLVIPLFGFVVGRVEGGGWVAGGYQKKGRTRARREQQKPLRCPGMARAPERAMCPVAPCLFFILFVFLRAVTVFSGDLRGPALVIHGEGETKAMLLPLVLRAPNSTRQWGAEGDYYGQRRRRQQLQRAGDQKPFTARMRLYDDLLTNGYYTTRLWIGTPPQEFALIVDSGSTVTYVPCSTCEQCGNHQDPRFQPDLSSTYKPVKCNIDCTCDDEKNQCTYERQYAEMSSSSGVLGDDLISFGKESALEPQHAVFGCENLETGDLFSQHADGIMGLGRGQLSIMDQLVDKGVITDSFSLCYGGMDIGGGAMVLGGISPPSEMVFSHSDPVRSPYYNIELKEMHISGKSLQLNPRVFDSKHGTVLDSGTTYAYLPEAAFVAFRDAIMKQLHSLKQIRGPDPNYKDICFSGAGSDVSQLSKTFPEVDMVFSNGQKLSLSPENYLFRHSKVHGAYCLGVFQNGKDPTTLLGGIIVRNTLVMYDRENERIGFWKTNCSQLWERLHLRGAPFQASSPASPASYMKNSTLGPSPALSPGGSPGGILSAEFKVGFITFDMSLSINISDIVPHISQLSELIARDLDVNVSQVQVMSFKGEGNVSLIKWGISPESPSGFIPSAAAMGIISRLTEHRVHLPENFGTYKLVEWKVEPPSRRTWWRRHLLAIIMGVSMVVLLSFSTFFVWYLWRHRLGAGTYRPVESSMPEQELQPL